MRSLHRIGAKADTLTPYASATATVGIWHGAYLVEPHYSESIYVNMPRWGLAVAGEQVPAVGRMSEARTRMKAAD